LAPSQPGLDLRSSFGEDCVKNNAVFLYDTFFILTLLQLLLFGIFSLLAFVSDIPQPALRRVTAEYRVPTERQINLPFCISESTSLWRRCKTKCLATNRCFRILCALVSVMW